MEKKRLLKLAKLLEADAKNKKGMKFDLDQILVSEDPDSDSKPKWNCGTTGCAIGLAMLSGAFKKQGLGIAYDYSSLQPQFEDKVGFGVADKAFFGLTTNEHDFLFTPNAYRGKTTGKKGELKVAKRIREFVKGEVKPPSSEYDL